MGKRNPIAKALASDLYRRRVVDSEKAYDRRQETAAIMEQLSPYQTGLHALAYEDGEIIGWSQNSNGEEESYLLCWDAEKMEAYCCGETLYEFGEHNLSIGERKRLGL
jgi:hypothetical protein